jgi:hypothetical protein
MQERAPLACLQHLACCVCEDAKVIVFAVLLVTWPAGGLAEVEETSGQCDKAKVGLALAILEYAAAEAAAESPAPAAENYPGGRKDGMALSTTRKFKSLQAVLAESPD